MDIRRASRSYREVIAELIKHLGQALPEEIPEDVDVARWWTTLDSMLDSPDHVFLIGEEEDRAIGLLVMDIRPSLYDGRPTAVITDFVVREGYRRKGYGSALVARGESEAGNRGCRRLEVKTEDYNSRAISFYRSSGFQTRHIFFEKKV